MHQLLQFLQKLMLFLEINFVFVQAEEVDEEEHLEKATYDETLNKEELQ